MYLKKNIATKVLCNKNIQNEKKKKFTNEWKYKTKKLIKNK